MRQEWLANSGTPASDGQWFMRREFKWSKENSEERNASGKATKTRKTLQNLPITSHKTVREAKAKRDLVTLVDTVETTVLMGDKAADSTRNRSDRCCDNRQQQQRYTAPQVNTKVHSTASEHNCSPTALSWYAACRAPSTAAGGVNTEGQQSGGTTTAATHVEGGGEGGTCSCFPPYNKQRALGQGGTAPAARSAGKGTSVGTVQQHTGGDSAVVRATNSSAIERSQVQVPAVPAGELSSPGSTFCADSHFGIPSRPTTPPPRPCPTCYRSST